MSKARLSAVLISVATAAAWSQTPPATEVREISVSTPIGNSPDRLDRTQAVVACPAGCPMVFGGATLFSLDPLSDAPLALVQYGPVETTGWSASAQEMVEGGDASAGHYLKASAYCQMPTVPLNPHIQVITRSQSLPPNARGWESVSATAECPAGRMLLGGGAEIATAYGVAPEGIHLIVNTASGNGWTVAALEDAAGSPYIVTATAYAVCADAGSGFSAPTVLESVQNLPDLAGIQDQGSLTSGCGAKTLTGGGAKIGTTDLSAPVLATLLYQGPVPAPVGSWRALAVETSDRARGAGYLTLSSRIHCFDKSAAVKGVVRLQGMATPVEGQEGVLDSWTVYAACPAGKSLIGGGAAAMNLTSPAGLGLMASHPFQNGWRAVFRETFDTSRGEESDLAVAAYAICAELPQ